MSYMTISSQEKHHFSLFSYFHAHPTTLLLKILGGTKAWAVPPPQILGGTVPSSPPRSPPLLLPLLVLSLCHNILWFCPLLVKRPLCVVYISKDLDSLRRRRPTWLNVIVVSILGQTNTCFCIFPGFPGEPVKLFVQTGQP